MKTITILILIAISFAQNTYAKTSAEYLKDAKNECAEAQFTMACRYKDGFNVGGDNIEMDKNKALFWLKKSAFNGYASAQFCLAGKYAKGEDIVKQNNIEALVWYLITMQDEKWGTFEIVKLLKSKMTNDEINKAEYLVKVYNKKIENNKNHIINNKPKINPVDVTENALKLRPSQSMRVKIKPLTVEKVADSNSKKTSQTIGWLITHTILGDINLDQSKGEYFSYDNYPSMIENEIAMLRNNQSEIEETIIRNVKNGCAIVVRENREMKAVTCLIIDPVLRKEGIFMLNAKTEYSQGEFVKNGVYRLAETLSINGFTTPVLVED